MRYDRRTVNVLLAAGNEARSLGHSCVGSAHLLLALCRSATVAGNLLRNAGMEAMLAETALHSLYGLGTPQLPLPQGWTRQAKHILFQAGQETKALGSREIGTVHLLLAILRAERSDAWVLLQLGCVETDMLFTAALDRLRSITSSGAPGSSWIR